MLLPEGYFYSTISGPEIRDADTPGYSWQRVPDERRPSFHMNESFRWSPLCHNLLLGHTGHPRQHPAPEAALLELSNGLGHEGCRVGWRELPGALDVKVLAEGAGVRPREPQDASAYSPQSPTKHPVRLRQHNMGDTVQQCIDGTAAVMSQ